MVYSWLDRMLVLEASEYIRKKGLQIHHQITTKPICYLKFKCSKFTNVISEMFITSRLTPPLSLRVSLKNADLHEVKISNKYMTKNRGSYAVCQKSTFIHFEKNTFKISVAGKTLHRDICLQLHSCQCLDSVKLTMKN